MKKTKVFLDFEYIESKDRTTQKTICGAFHSDGNTLFFKCLNNTNNIVKHVNSLPEGTVMIAYNIIAEIVTLLREGVSIDKIRSFEWVDLWIESKMFMLTHPDYYSESTSLKEGAVPVFGLSYPFDMNKDPIKIILEGNGSYNSEEWNQIKLYNIADVEILPHLLHKLKDLWVQYGVQYEEILLRSEFAIECAYQYYNSNGFPMDEEAIKAVFDNRELIKLQIMKEVNTRTGFPIYRAKVKKRPDELSFNLEGFENYLKQYGLYQIWDKTANVGDTDKNGKLKKIKVSVKEDTFEKFLSIDSFLSENKTLLESIYYGRNTIKQLNSTNLSELLTKDGYIKTPPFPFDQKSGRSSPKPSLGFILNLVPWLRNCIKPKKGMAFISADWSQQEIALAGYFSQDQKLLDSYKGDHYITNAIACGFAPPGATKKSHPQERELMKPTSLGIIYGMGVKSMAFRVETAMGWVHDKEKVELDMWTVKDGEFIKNQVLVSKRAYEAASKFIEGHKNYYTTYWNYVEQHYYESISNGYYKTPITGWYYFTEPNHKPTQLQNIPNQAAGAAVMQLGYIFASRAGLSIICSLHDALYVECKVEDIEQTKKTLLSCMAKAVEVLTNNTITIRNEVKVFTEDNPYSDPRGIETYELVMNLLNGLKSK